MWVSLTRNIHLQKWVIRSRRVSMFRPGNIATRQLSKDQIKRELRLQHLDGDHDFLSALDRYPSVDHPNPAWFAIGEKLYVYGETKALSREEAKGKVSFDRSWNLSTYEVRVMRQVTDFTRQPMKYTIIHRGLFPSMTIKKGPNTSGLPDTRSLGGHQTERSLTSRRQAVDDEGTRLSSSTRINSSTCSTDSRRFCQRSEIFKRRPQCWYVAHSHQNGFSLRLLNHDPL